MKIGIALILISIAGASIQTINANAVWDYVEPQETETETGFSIPNLKNFEKTEEQVKEDDRHFKEVARCSEILSTDFEAGVQCQTEETLRHSNISASISPLLNTSETEGDASASELTEEEKIEKRERFYENNPQLRPNTSDSGFISDPECSPNCPKPPQSEDEQGIASPLLR
jgi:hypothetical protein